MYVDGTEGHSGTDTSRERAERERDTGRARVRRSQVLNHLQFMNYRGATSSEVEHVLGIHHGQASSALSNLHKAGWIVRTKRRRNRSKVYVTPQYMLADDIAEPFVPRGKVEVDRLTGEVAELESRIAFARIALMTGESSTRVLRILDGRS